MDTKSTTLKTSRKNSAASELEKFELFYELIVSGKDEPRGKSSHKSTK